MDKSAIGAVLAAVKAQGRTSLTAPEAKAVCDACAIAVTKEGPRHLRQTSRRAGG